MKAESLQMPSQPFEINDFGDEAEVTLLENIEEIAEAEESPHKWTWDEYRLRVKKRANLADSVENNFAVWLTAAKAKAYEEAAKSVRAKRDALLAESDRSMCLDRLGVNAPETISATTMLSALRNFFDVMRSAVSGEWAIYRQALRDIPAQSGFPYNVTFPERPEA